MMKRKSIIISILIIIFITIILLLNMGLVNNFGKESVIKKEILKEFANNLINKEGLLTGSFDEYGYYNYDGKNEGFEKDRTGYNGILSLCMSDLDMDGEDELLVVSLESKDEDINKVKLTVYKDRVGSVKKINSIYLMNNIPNINKFSCEVCIKTTKEGTIVYFEDNADATIFADGYFWYFSKSFLNTSGFENNIYKEHRGTDWSEENYKEYLETVRNAGLDIKELFGELYISSQDSDIKKLCSIERESTENISISNKEISKYMDNKTIVKDLRMKYGKTTFYNYIDLKEFK